MQGVVGQGQLSSHFHPSQYDYSGSCPADRLFEIEAGRELCSFEPHPHPPLDTNVFIIAQLSTDVTQITQHITQHGSVIINFSAQEGLESDPRLRHLWQGSRDRRSRLLGGSIKLSLSDERSGLLMVYKVYDLIHSSASDTG